MIIVAGALTVAADRRDAYLRDCVSVVDQARSAPGCLDFALSADLVDAGRINVYERWASERELSDFRGSGPDDAQQQQILDATVGEFTVEERQ